MNARGADDGDRIDVRSPDGTTIAVFVEGEGPAVVLAHGGLNDHTVLAPLVDELRAGVTTYTMDRRGRGGSGDAEPYSIEREFDDVAAVVDAVAERTGGPVVLFGHSYGADCGMGAATRTGNLRQLILYEPGLGVSNPPAAVEAVEAALAAGDLEAAVVAVCVDVVGMTADELELYRSRPTWATRVALAPTVPRELRAESEWVYRPGQFDAVRVPTVILAGSASPPEQQEATRRAAAAIPGARIHVLEGHGHTAHQTDPAMVAGLIRQLVTAAG